MPADARDRVPTRPPAAPRRLWRRPSTWFATAFLVASLAMVAFAFASLVAPGTDGLPDRPDVATVLATSSVFAALPTVGALLAILRPGNPIGWLFLLCGIGFIIGIFSTEYVGRAVLPGASLPGIVVVDWLGVWTGTLSITVAVTWIPLLFPDGHLPGPRWRPVAWAAGVLAVAGVLALAILPDASHGYTGRLANPTGVGGPVGDAAGIVTALYFPALAIIGLLSVASLVVRFRRSRGVERQQLKWFLLAGGFLLAAVVVALGTTDQVAWYLVMLALASLPVAAGIAVLRYRLYDIDRIISRTVSYAIVTGVLALVFVGVVIVFQAVLAPVLGKNPVAVAASTLVVAALFQPLRGRVQRIVDRRFDRARYDAERIVSGFTANLRDDVDVRSLERDVRDVVQRTVAPTTVGLWMRGSDLEP